MHGRTSADAISLVPRFGVKCSSSKQTQPTSVVFQSEQKNSLKPLNSKLISLELNQKYQQNIFSSL
jgi:hypothetical protein